MTDKILPCPFCGGPAEINSVVVEGYVFCRPCKVTLARYHNRYQDDGLEKAIAAWNQRTPIASSKTA